MLYAIVRRDRPGMEDERSRLQPVHAQYQAPFLSKMVFGGGLVVEGTNTETLGYDATGIRSVVGNVIVIDVPDRAAAEAFHNDDPYTQNDLFESVLIERFWQRVPPPEK